jgi:hypothetical protein
MEESQQEAEADQGMMQTGHQQLLPYQDVMMLLV